MILHDMVFVSKPTLVATSRPLLFLDMDGVVNGANALDFQPKRGGYLRRTHFAEPALLERLRGLVEEHDAGIVVSSSWRIKLTREQFINFTAPWLRRHVLHGAAWATPITDRGHRGVEINMWAKANRKYDFSRYAALDDSIDYHDYQPWVRTNTRTGLTDQELGYVGRLFEIGPLLLQEMASSGVDGHSWASPPSFALRASFGLRITTMTPYQQHMPGLKQLEREAMQSPAGLAMIAVLLNQEIERRLIAGKPTEEDIGMLERAAQRAGR